MGVRWAAALDAVDDMPVAGIFDCRRVGLVGDADLTTAASVDRSIGTVTKLESKDLRGAYCHFLTAGRGERDAMAREVAPAGIKRVFRCRALDWSWGLDEEMSIDRMRQA